MSAIIRTTLACLAWSLPLAMMAQTAPAPAGSTVMDMPSVPGMAHHHAGHAQHPSHAGHGKSKQGTPRRAAGPIGTAAQAASSMAMPDVGHVVPAAAKPATEHADHAPGTMQSMDHARDAMPYMDHMKASPHGSDKGMDHGEGHAMHAMRMQGGAAPPDARSADYSDGIGQGDMTGMEMRDAEPLGMLRLDRLEAFSGLHGNGQAWELNGWYGTDSDRLWLRSEGEREGGRLADGDIEALWSHAAAPYWDVQFGMRHDSGGGPSRQWIAFGVQGLAPYWFELEATGYAGPSGRTAARLRAEYELLLTQRLILQPELEANLYGKADQARHTGSGLSDASFGLRLRYEIRRQFAPYLGVAWTRRFGGTAGFARDGHQPAFDRQLVAGLRVWF